MQASFLHFPSRMVTLRGSRQSPNSHASSASLSGTARDQKQHHRWQWLNNSTVTTLQIFAWKAALL